MKNNTLFLNGTGGSAEFILVATKTGKIVAAASVFGTAFVGYINRYEIVKSNRGV
jgi:hypothetical protein